MPDIDKITMLRMARTLQAAADLVQKSWNPATKTYAVSEVNAVHAMCRASGFNHPFPILLLLTGAWDDARDWARQTIEQEDGPR